MKSRQSDGLSVLSGISALQGIFPAVFGAFLGLALLKFGNPPIMEEFVTPPSNAWEVVLNSPWPIHWGYIALAFVGLIALFSAKWSLAVPGWLAALPLLWLLWQCLASAQTISKQLTNPTLEHFVACVVCFYLALFSLSRAQSLTGFWLSIACAFLLVLAFGWQQHFGGLEQTRQYFFAYLYPQAKGINPDYLKKISSNRIFSTLFYPNSLAGALLLFFPGILDFIWGARQRFTPGARMLLAGSVTIGTLGCLYWSGSKGGWLLMLLLSLVALMRMPFQTRAKIALVIGVVLIGLGCFFAKYAGFFKKGATSVSARFDYWSAALSTASRNPIFGTGPGTFARPYASIKRPESEMTRMVHNDYLEQASDSGWPGFVIYISFVSSVVFYTGRRMKPSSHISSQGSGTRAAKSQTPLRSADLHDSKSASGLLEHVPPELFAIWLGVLGWALHSFFEFSLYIPALAWSAFTFAGLLLGRLGKAIDKA